MSKIIIVIACVLIIFGGMFGVLFYVIKKTNPNNANKSKSGNNSKDVNKSVIESTQSELSFKDISNKMIDVGNNKYRVILECTSINYLLKSEAEQELIDETFRNFVNSLNYPISFFVQTRLVDNSKMMESLGNKISKTIQSYPGLKNYGNYYYNEMNNLYDTIGNNYERRKYIIIPYDDVNKLTKLTESEKEEHVIEELERRIVEVVGALNNLNINATLVDSYGLVDILYHYYNKKSMSMADNIDIFLSQFIAGSDKLTDAQYEQQLERILLETESKLRIEMDKKIDGEYSEIAEECLNQIYTLRQNLGSFYKDKSVHGIVFNYNT